MLIREKMCRSLSLSSAAAYILLTSLINVRYASSDAYTDTAYDICDRFRTWRVLPAIKRGEITTPGFPASVDKLKTCSVHLQVPQFWWIGIYARNFTLPEGSCVDSTELQISWDEGEKLRHFCGQQKGLIYNHFTALNSGFMHLTFRSIPKHQTTARFHLEYKVAAAIHSKHYKAIILENLALPAGYIVSHDGFSSTAAEGQYPVNISSNLTIEGLPPNSKIELRFPYFDLREETDGTCGDYLEVIGVLIRPSNSSLPRICGQKKGLFRTVFTMSDRVVLKFITGVTNQNHLGFMLHYRVVGYKPVFVTQGPELDSHRNLTLQNTPLPINIADRPNTVTPFHPSNKHGVSRSREGKDYSQNEGRSYVDFIGAGIGAGMFVIVLAIVTAICMGRRQGQSCLSTTTDESDCYSVDMMTHQQAVNTVSRYEDDDDTYYNEVAVDVPVESMSDLYHDIEERGTGCPNHEIQSCSGAQSSEKSGHKCGCDGTEYANCESIIRMAEETFITDEYGHISAKTKKKKLPKSKSSIEWADNDIYDIN